MLARSLALVAGALTEGGGEAVEEVGLVSASTTVFGPGI